MGPAQDTPQPPYDISDEYRPEPPKPPERPAWQDGSIRIGIHTSIAGDITGALEAAHRLGANALQIFSASPRMWPRSAQGPGTPLPGAAERFRARRAALGLGPFVIHDNYLINLASPEPVLCAKSIQAFHDELVRAMALGADFLVAHLGARRGNGARHAIRNLAAALHHATRGLKLGRLRILLENSAGQGTALGARFEELKEILDACPEAPLGICLDTAHAFAAGYDIRSAEGLEQTLEAVERTVGLRRVFVVHVNDSKAPLGSHVDRHEHIGRGRIGLEAFRRILNHPLLAGRAFILETPIDKPGDDRRNVRALWKLVGVNPRQVRGARNGFTPSRGRRRTRSKGAGSLSAKRATRKASQAVTRHKGKR